MENVRVRLDGFADERGDAAYNQEAFSSLRAEAVRDALVAAGVSRRTRIEVNAHGESASPDDSIDSYALERKVSLTLFVDESPSFAATPNNGFARLTVVPQGLRCKPPLGRPLNLKRPAFLRSRAANAVLCKSRLSPYSVSRSGPTIAWKRSAGPAKVASSRWELMRRASAGSDPWRFRRLAARRERAGSRERFEFSSFGRTMAFVNAVAWVATVEGHHPHLLRRLWALRSSLPNQRHQRAVGKRFHLRCQDRPPFGR